MAVKDAENIIDNIRGLAIPIESYPDDFLGAYKLINDSLTAGKERLKKLENLDLIIVEDLYKDYERLEPINNYPIVVKNKNRETLTIFILGKFDREFPVVQELSEIFADFYIEFLLLPLFKIIDYELLPSKLRSLKHKLKNGVLVYESERSLHRNSTAIHS
jgi:hypothetical protein